MVKRSRRTRQVVVSELRKATANQNVLAWHAQHAQDDVFLSVLVIGEIRQGIERIRSRDRMRAEAFDAWLRGLLSGYRDRILPITVEIADEWWRMKPTRQRGPRRPSQ